MEKNRYGEFPARLAGDNLETGILKDMIRWLASHAHSGNKEAGRILYELVGQASYFYSRENLIKEAKARGQLGVAQRLEALSAKPASSTP